MIQIVEYCSPPNKCVFVMNYFVSLAENSGCRQIDRSNRRSVGCDVAWAIQHVVQLGRRR